MYKKILISLLQVLLFIVPTDLYGQKGYLQPGEGTALPDNIPTASTGYPYLDLFYRQLAENTYNDVKSRRHELLNSVPLETFMDAYIKRGMDVLADTASLFDYFDEGRTPLSIEERSGAFIARMAEIARRQNNIRLNLVVDFFRGTLINSADYDKKMEWFEEVIRKSQKARDSYMEVHTLENMWATSYFGEIWARSFVYAQRLEEALDRLDDTYPLKGNQYVRLGFAYYTFKDYDKAVSLLYKGLSYRCPSHILFSGNYIRAWNYLGVYHQRNNELDSAAYYHRLILESPEGPAGQPAHAAIALSNLGRLEHQKGHTDTAIVMLQAGLNYMENHHRDMPFITGLYTSLGECYLAKGDTAATREYIGKALREVNEFSDIQRANRLKDIYALESNYYSSVGQPELSKVYLDSTLATSARYEQLSGQHIVLRGEQELQEAEAKHAKEQMARQQYIILTILGVLCVFAVTLLILLRLYRKKNAAYTALAARAIEWSRQNEMTINTTPATSKEEPTDEDRRIMSLVEREMTEKQAYRDATLSAESLAESLGIHRNALSKAINRVTDGNYTQYVNRYRIKEGVRIISQNRHKDLYIDELYERVGFNNRSSFYRAFKQFTGLSPVEFQRNTNSVLRD